MIDMAFKPADWSGNDSGRRNLQNEQLNTMHML